MAAGRRLQLHAGSSLMRLLLLQSVSVTFDVPITAAVDSCNKCHDS